MKNPLTILKDLLFEYNERLSQEDFEAKKLNDGEYKASDLAPGKPLELIDGDGNLATAPDGEYELPNGDKLEVKDGLIATVNGVKPEVQPSEEKPVEMASEEVVDQEQGNKSQTSVEELTAKVTTLEQRIAEFEASLGHSASKEDVHNFNESLRQLNETLAVIAKTPADFSKTSNNNIIKDAREAKLKEFAKALRGK